MDKNTLLQYLQLPGLLGIMVPKVVTVLRDMNGPIDLNNGQALAAIEMQYETDQTSELAKLILAMMESRGHDAFAFYQFKENDGKKSIRYGTIALQTKSPTP